jgi:membrane-anchored glycerophosphoryl diester phosphodiesterase (GDPDase)
MVLSRSFAALRHNPRVLLGFALAVQGIAYLITVVIVGAVSYVMFARLDNVAPSSDAYDQVLAGSIGVVLITALVLSLAVSAFGVLVQGVVVVDVARGVLAERPTLREIWAQVRPVAWRLIGYAALLMAAAVVGVAVAAVIAILAGVANVAAGIIVGVFAFLASIPLWLWLTAKLALAPAAILLERATVGGAIARSWRLTRGRFWPVLGVIVVISLAFFVLGEIVAVPFSLIGGLLGGVFAPTGGDQQAVVIQLIVTGIVQVIVLLIQVVGSIVQATASCLLYVDCRMRHEGLDLDLLAYVERRDAGDPDPADPYTAGIGRIAAPRPLVPQWGPAAVPGQWGPPPAAPAQWGPPPTPSQWGPPPVPPAPVSPAPPGSPVGPDSAPDPSSPPPMAPPR